MRWLAIGMVATVATAGCEESTGPRGGFEEDAAVVAADTDLELGAMIENALTALDGGPSSAPPGSWTREFERNRACPAGGRIEVSGEVERTRNDDGVKEWSIEGSGEWIECARARRDRRLEIDGDFAFDAHRKRTHGDPVGEQVSHISGAFVWSHSSGESGECEFELTSVRDPDTHTRTVTGTVCGRAIERRISWDRP